VPNSRAGGRPRRGTRELVTAANSTLPRLSAPGSAPIASMKKGKAQDATDELASYLRRDPYDVAARQTYLILLYEQGRYAETACESDLAVEDESQNESVLGVSGAGRTASRTDRSGAHGLSRCRGNVSAPRRATMFAANSEIDLLDPQRQLRGAQKP